MNPSKDQLSSYPGSPLLAMRKLGSGCSYLFCDVDGGSVAHLEATAAALKIEPRVQVVASDGMTALHHALSSTTPDGTIIARSELSASGLACELIERQVGLVYWYGHNRPERRAWAFDELCQRSRTRT